MTDEVVLLRAERGSSSESQGVEFPEPRTPLPPGGTPPRPTSKSRSALSNMAHVVVELTEHVSVYGPFSDHDEAREWAKRKLGYRRNPWVARPILRRSK